MIIILFYLSVPLTGKGGGGGANPFWHSGTGRFIMLPFTEAPGKRRIRWYDHYDMIIILFYLSVPLTGKGGG